MHFVKLFKLDIDELDDEDEVGEWVDDGELIVFGVVELLGDIVNNMLLFTPKCDDLDIVWIPDNNDDDDDGYIISVSFFFLVVIVVVVVVVVDVAVLAKPALLLLVWDKRREIIFLTLVCSELFTIGNSISLFLFTVFISIRFKEALLLLLVIVVDGAK